MPQLQGTNSKKPSTPLQRLSAQCRSALAGDADFSRAVNDCNVEGAASKALDILMELVQQHFPRSLYGTTVPPGRAQDPALISTLLNIGDEVVSTHNVAKDGPTETCSSSTQMVGNIVGIAQPDFGRPPLYTVRWGDSSQTKENMDQLVVHRKREHLPSERFVSCKLHGLSPPATKCQQAILADLRTALLLFEGRLPWTCVTRSFAGSRGGWRKELSHSTSLRQFVRSYVDFLQHLHVARLSAVPKLDALMNRLYMQYLKIDQHLPTARLQCNAPGTLNALHRCADEQDYVGVQQIWLEQIMPDFEMWQTAAHGKQKPGHIHTGRAMHILESACSAQRPASLTEVPWGAFMNQEQLAALKLNLQREVDFCERKCEDLRAIIKREAPLTDAVMTGVTYDDRGLGGTYGGVPRARPSMLDGVWNYRSDVDTEDDTGSEATDLADSLFASPVTDLLDDGAVSSERMAGIDNEPARKRARSIYSAPDVKNGGASAESRDGSSSCMAAS